MTTVSMRPGEVPEWDAEEMLSGSLAEEVWPANEIQAREMLNDLRIELPDTLQHTDLVAFAGERATPLDETLRPSTTDNSFYLIGLPVPLVVPEDRRLVRLRLRMGLPDRSVAWDVFPRTEWVTDEHQIATATLDVGKALTFVFPAVGQALGLKLEAPIHFTTTHARVQSTGPNSNPVDWLLDGDQVRAGFTAWLILCGPRHEKLDVSVRLACELRRSGVLGHLLRATFVSDEEHYVLGSP